MTRKILWRRAGAEPIMSVGGYSSPGLISGLALSSLQTVLDQLEDDWQDGDDDDREDDEGEILLDRKSTRLNSSHIQKSRMPSSA